MGVLGVGLRCLGLDGSGLRVGRSHGVTLNALGME